MWLRDESQPQVLGRVARRRIDHKHIGAAPSEDKTEKLADLIDHSQQHHGYGQDLARVYLLQMRRLLLNEALRDGDARLLGACGRQCAK
jgi:hypothetical protein